jgi:hypothetical protein
MKGLLILEEEDFNFVVDPHKKSSQMRLAIEGEYSLVLFYTNECDKCSLVKTDIMRFIGNKLNVQICMVNVYDESCAGLIEKSLQTTTPLKYVPFVVFYIQGFPFKIFDCEHSSLVDFLTNTVTEADTVVDTTKIPPYSIGKPNSSKVCYLTYKKAY